MIAFYLNITKKGVTTPHYHTIPESWSEVASEKPDAIGTLRTILTEKEIPAKIKILKGWLNLPKQLFKALPDEVIGDLIATMSWLKPDSLSMPLITEFEHQGITYHLPKPNFANCTALEFALSDDFFKKVAEKNDADALIKLTATICRPSRTDAAEAIIVGDIRTPLLSRSEVEHRAKQLDGLDSAVQISVFLYFAGVKHYIAETYGKHIFEERDPETEDNKTSQNAEPLGWWGIFMEMAQSPIHLKAIHDMNFHTLCLWLVRNKILSERTRQLITKSDFKEED